MAAAIAAWPPLIRPNHEELAELVGCRLATVGDVVDAAYGRAPYRAVSGVITPLTAR